MNKYQIISQTFFKDQAGNPFLLTTGQSEIFKIVYEPGIARGVIRATTQYGKSDIASMAIITIAIRRQEKILIVSPSEKQSMIIMNYVIGHLFDDEDITGMIEWEGSLERLKQERSKRRITFKNGSEIFILTANVDTVSREAKNLMGFGASVVIVDESSLIPDTMFSKVLRMIGGHKKTKLIHLGNPFERNHFWRAFYSPRYQKLIIKKEQAIEEGRLDPDFVQECKEEMPPMDFQIFYECEFPEGGSEDSLIPFDWIKLAINQEVQTGKLEAGVDVARFGRDKSIYCLKDGAKVIKFEENSKVDTMALVGWLRGFLDNDKPEMTKVDVIGVGSGVYDRLVELEYKVADVNVGESPTDEEAKKKFYNLRAEILWSLRELFKPENGKSQISIPEDPELVRQLSELRYNFSSERKIRIEGKENMKKRIGQSPDKVDALALAFFNIDTSVEMYIV